ncbi:MAG TPA: hypothetical protein VE944_31265 [Nostoc sp.]|uniref:hypothetical protein n=1 Tax=Nostoc sp. TaxID=1180 RepID=UPI002D32A0E9|nr:hypothetical protein [Nostoc sp.]HYX18771.1 hypothetical protein [Nostoc sp.]
MPTWNGTPLPTSPTPKIPNSIPQNFNWDTFKADPKGTFNKFKGAREVHRLNWKGYRTATASTKKIIISSPSKKFIAEAGKRIRQLKKVADTTKKAADTATKVNDALLKKSPGKNSLDKANRAGVILGILVAIGVVALLKLQEFTTGRIFDDLLRTQIDLSTTHTIATNNTLKLKTLNTRIQKFERELDVNAKDYYRLNKQQETLGKNIVDAKKQANDALYETRQGRTIVEGKIAEAKKQANDALYETRQNKSSIENKITEQRTSLEAKIQQVNTQIAKFASGVSDNFQKGINSTISKIQSDIATTRAKVDAIKSPTPINTSEINANAVAAARAIVNPLQSQIGILANQTNAATTLAGTAINGVSNLAQGVLGANNTASLALSRANTAQATGENAQRQAESTKTYVDRVLVPRIEATVTQSTGVTAEMAKLEAETQNTRIYVDRVLVPRIEATVTQSTGVKAEVAQIKAEIADIKKQEIPELSGEIKRVQIQISEVNTKLKEQEKVNDQALPKLDQILGILPLIPARAANAIRPDIPTIPQIEQAAATGTCRTTQPGGCMNKALKDNAADITNNNNTNAANILDAVNTGANAALLAGQETILARLGAQLPGGIGGKLSRFADWMHLDRVLNIMILGATSHNALMLSNDIGQTFVGIINNVLQLIGLKKENGDSFDIGSVISGSIENLIKGAIGAENYTNLTTAWAKANRIYQASINILNVFQGLSSAILTGLEMTAGKVAKIGNALRKSGEVLESAYGWMNPQPKFNRVTQTLENLQQGASTIQMVTQAPLDIINATTELTTATTELANAIKQDDNEANKGKESPEPDKLKADQAAAKLASAGLEILDLDLEADA